MVDKTLESEDQLIDRAKQALSACSWTLGECAALWTKRYAKGRTDAAFGEMISLSADQVYQRRRVWETFGDVHEQYASLKWSHFYAAINWDDAAACLSWAEEMQSTVAEMRAWRRAQHGEDLSMDADEVEVPFDPTGEFLSVETGVVRDPSEMGYEGARRSFSGAGVATEERELTATATSVAREGRDDYAPFGKGARGPAPSDSDSDKPAAPTEQIAKRVVSTLEKCNQALTPEVLENFQSLPMAIQQRLINAVDNLASKVAGLR